MNNVSAICRRKETDLNYTKEEHFPTQADFK